MKQELIKNIKSLAREASQQWPHEEMVELREVLREINKLDEPEVLSQKWMKDNQIMKIGPEGVVYYVPGENLQNLLVPKPEVLSQEWIDEHAKAVAYDGMPDQTEIVYVDELKNLLVPKQELPVIPQFVADWIENIKPDSSLRVAFGYIAQRKADNHDDPLSFWLKKVNYETFARAWLDGYEVEKEKLYYIKFSENQYAQRFDGTKIDSILVNDKSIAGKFTKEEIKKMNANFMALAVEVAE